MLDRFLALNRSPNVRMRFGIDQSLQAITLGEAIHGAVAMLLKAPRQIGRHADIENAVRLIRNDVNLTACHVAMLPVVDARNKSEHDVNWRCILIVMAALVAAIQDCLDSRVKPEGDD
jgi:hypothetical protein